MHPLQRPAPSQLSHLELFAALPQSNLDLLAKSSQENSCSIELHCRLGFNFKYVKNKSCCANSKHISISCQMPALVLLRRLHPRSLWQQPKPCYLRLSRKCEATTDVHSMHAHDVRIPLLRHHSYTQDNIIPVPCLFFLGILLLHLLQISLYTTHEK